MKKTIETIAKQRLDIETLETRGCDRLDFHDLSVAGIKAALEAAYRAGSQAAIAEAQAQCPSGDEGHDGPAGCPSCMAEAARREEEDSTHVERLEDLKAALEAARALPLEDGSPPHVRIFGRALQARVGELIEGLEFLIEVERSIS